MIDDLVSIIMPVYNGETTIGESISSVLAQSYECWELIIVDDCSTDDTRSVIGRYNDSRIHYHIQAENAGVAQARNRGIELAKGRFIAFLDSDDLWLPEKLTRQIAFMRENHYGFTYTEYRYFTGKLQNISKLVRVKDVVDYKELLRGNSIGCLTVVLDKKMFPNIEMPKWRHEDYITWLNMLKNGAKAYGMHEDLARYRKSMYSLSGNKWKSLYWTWLVYYKNQKIPFFQSIKYILLYIGAGIKKHIL